MLSKLVKRLMNNLFSKKDLGNVGTYTEYTPEVIKKDSLSIKQQVGGFTKKFYLNYNTIGVLKMGNFNYDEKLQDEQSKIDEENYYERQQEKNDVLADRAEEF